MGRRVDGSNSRNSPKSLSRTSGKSTSCRRKSRLLRYVLAIGVCMVPEGVVDLCIDVAKSPDITTGRCVASWSSTRVARSKQTGESVTFIRSRENRSSGAS